MDNTNLKKLIIISLIILLVGWILKPFIYPILFASLLAIMIYPLQQKLELKFKSTHKSSLLSVLLVLFIVITPLILLISSTIDEIIYYINNPDLISDFLVRLKEYIMNMPYVGNFIAKHIQDLDNFFINNKKTILSHIASFIPTIQYIGSKSLGLIFSFLITLVITYQLLASKETIKKLAEDVVFHGFKFKDEFISVAINTTRRVSLAVFTTASIVAIGMGSTYAILGLPSPMILALVTAIAAMIPFMVAVVYIFLAVTVFLFMGATKAIILVVIGIILNMITDNIIQPKIINKGASLGFVASLLGIMGGVEAFGIIGLFLGPVIFNVVATWITKALESKTKEIS